MGCRLLDATGFSFSSRGTASGRIPKDEAAVLASWFEAAFRASSP